MAESAARWAAQSAVGTNPGGRRGRLPQSSALWKRTTSPTTTIEGVSIPVAAATTSLNVDTTTRCAAVVALLMTATGSSGRRPPDISRSAMLGKCRAAIYSTSTGAPRAIACQSRPPGTAPSLSWPVRNVTAELVSRWVSGIPA